MVEVFNAIYEEDFLGFSYGFRPRRGQHDALDALAVGITRTPVNWIVDIDVRSFFDTVSHEWLIRFVEHGASVNGTIIVQEVEPTIRPPGYNRRGKDSGEGGVQGAPLAAGE